MSANSVSDYRMRTYLLFLYIFILSAFTSACTIHTIDIQQGNVIEQEAVEQLELGMSPQRVRFIMGTPLLQDPFHQNRWDYVYYLQDGKHHKATVQQRVTVYFENDKVVKIDKQLPEPEKG